MSMMEWSECQNLGFTWDHTVNIRLVMCLGCSCNCKVRAVGLDHNECPMGL